MNVVPSPTRPRLDLRTESVPDVVAEVEHVFGTQLDTAAAVIKRRSFGAPTGRGTWVRIEARAFDRLHGQNANGVETSALVPGVDKPAWYRGMSWPDVERGVLWRADETGLVTAAPISSGGYLATKPDLPDTWWRSLTRSLAARTRLLGWPACTPSPSPRSASPT